MTSDQHVLWSNWSGSQQSHPQIFYPHHIDTLKQITDMYPKVRVVGAGHSFSALAKTNDVLVSLDHLKGMLNHDAEHYQSEFYAGTRLFDLGEKLAVVDQALMNQGDIDQQSLGGAIATGTHGTGIELPCLSAFVSGFELLTADGSLLQCNPTQHTDIFAAGRVALGSFGVMTKIQLQNRPMYRLKEQIRLSPLSEIYQSIDQWKHQHRHVEFFAFIHAQDVILKTLDETLEDIQERKKTWIDEDFILHLCSELTRLCPLLNPYLQRLLNVAIQPSTVVDWSTRLFPSARATRFNEMEYQLPVDRGLECFQEIMTVLKRQKAPVFFPIEFRYVRADDIWLSPFFERDSVSISIHQFYKQDYALIFDLVEPIFLKYGGRPHWGKLHSLGAQQLRHLYPKWDDFMRLRRELDPHKKWLNPYMEQLLTS
ncbi:FAD-linked oxidoreductase [Acinetobacter sp. NCu2D-2]|uniref:D-arabinono-1,4-lactone oxidase n=1 Tax=Acinetobacter sp. NCu2D-2 TaxID=1608473 RepID=UPI0007CDB04D|nr:D-arabinono-1,4-lactone oxidase [Acinetobacter sp. NCu2D-2]ANF82477.1 FAD-linked oxidoreductase [Acinetobacter sp. NCu2D-2]